MSEKYRNKYRIETTRATWWDYAGNGAYFITICTQNREHYFGKIRDGMMHHSEIGELALSEWIKTPEIRPDMKIILDEFVVMPNHMHGIIIIGDCGCGGTMHCASTGKNPNHFGPQSKNLGSIIRGYKSAVTTYARKNNISFAWQSRFHDHIIRNEQEFQRIRNYIVNNPAKWENDSLK